MFDPYHKWLGIPKHQRPPTHYQLLGVDPTEHDRDVIEEAAVRQTTHLRAYQIGEHAADCTRLLNEISQARQVLLNPAKRKAYDDQLAQQQAPATDIQQAITAEAPAPNAFADLGDETAAAPVRRRPELRQASIKKPGRRWLVPALISGIAAAVVLGVFVMLLLWRNRPAPVAEGPKPPPKNPIVEPAPDPEKPNPPPVEPEVKPPDKVEVKPPAGKDFPRLGLIRQLDIDAGIKNIVYSPDRGFVVLTGAQSRRFELDAAKYTATFGNGNAGVALSPDGSKLYTVREAGTVDVWDTLSGNKLKTLPMTALRSLVALDAEGTTLAIGRWNRLLSLWDLTADRERATLDPKEPQGTVLECLALARDGKRLVSGHDRKLMLWNLENRTLIATHSEATPLDAAFHPSGDVAVCFPGELVIFNDKLQVKRRTKSRFIKIQITSDGKQLIGLTSGPPCLLYAKTWNDLEPRAEYGGHVEAFAVAPDNSRIAATDSQGKLYELSIFDFGGSVVKNTKPMPEKKPVVEVKAPVPAAMVRAPIPVESERQAAEKLMRERYAKELAKTLPTDRAALAEKLLKAADEVKDNAVDRYVLMAEAVNLAVLGVKPNLTAKTIDEFAQAFEIDAVKQKLSHYTTLAKTAQGKVSSKELGEVALAAARDAAFAEDVPLALQFVAIAKQAAPRAVVVGLVTHVQKQEASLQALAKELAAMQAAQKTLESQPGDAPAHAAVGRYLSLRRGEWDKGLQHLAKAGDDALAEAARQDLKNPSDSKAQAELGDLWYAAAEKENEFLKPALQFRALHWYRQALPQTTGLLQVKLTERVKTLDAVPAPFKIKEIMAELQRVKAHVGGVAALELSPDGKRVFSGGPDGFVRGWDPVSLKLLYTFPSKIPVSSFSFSPDGQYLAICSETRIQLWDLQRPAAKPRRDMGSMPGAFWLDADSLYRVDNQTFWSHEIKNGQGGGRKVPTTPVHKTVASPDKRIVAILADGDVQWIRMNDKGAVATVKSFCNIDAVAAAFSPDNLLLALGEKDGPIRIFDVNSKNEVKLLTGHVGAVRCLAFVSATRLLSGGDDKSVRVWDVAAGKENARVVHAGAVTAVTASADGRQAFSGSGDATLRRWELPPETK